MQDDFEEKPQEKPDFREYWRLAVRRRWYLLIPLFLGWLTVWGAGWLVPSIYRSGTLILVEQPSVPSQYVTSNVVGNLQDRLSSITQQILSRTRLLFIINKLNLYEAGKTRRSPDELVERMRKDIEIELVRSPEKREQLTAFNVYYSSTDPRVAQEVTSELTSLFISQNLVAQQQQSENTTKFLESQLAGARGALMEQEGKVRDFKDRFLGELPGQLQSNIQILTGLQTQLQAEQDALNRASQQHTYLQSLLGQYRALDRSVKSGDTVSVGLPAINQELDKLKAQLEDLSSHYTDRHPDVRKVKEQIAKTETLKQQIETDLKNKGDSPPGDSGSTTTTSDPVNIKGASPMMELQSQLKANEIELENRQKGGKALVAQIREYQGRLNRTPVREQQLSDLTRDYEQSKTDYDSLLAKKNQSTLASNLERQEQGEHFRILDPPSLPQKPFSPNRLLLSCIGIAVGLALGVGITLALEMGNDRIYSEKELRKLLPVPLMVELPQLNDPKQVRVHRQQVWLGWIAAGLMFMCIIAGSAFSYLRG
jgi:succinoglycan biosynthesis transport protein ExoP